MVENCPVRRTLIAHRTVAARCECVWGSVVHRNCSARAREWASRMSSSESVNADVVLERCYDPEGER